MRINIYGFHYVIDIIDLWAFLSYIPATSLMLVSEQCKTADPWSLSILVGEGLEITIIFGPELFSQPKQLSRR